MKTTSLLRLTVLLALGNSALAFAQAPPPPLPPLGPPPIPAGNPQTTAKINLGMTLFWEEQLSVTGTAACGTCHRSFSGGSDPRTSLDTVISANPGPDNIFGNADDIHGSPGVPAHAADGLYFPVASFTVKPQVGTRRSPSAIDAAYAPLLFWDGRAGGSFADPQTGQVLIATGGALENQSLQPLINSTEMSPSGALVNDIGARIANVVPLALATSIPTSLTSWIKGRAYPDLFNEAFGSSQMSSVHIAMAIASYERTLAANQTPLDSQPPNLTQQEQQGQQLFGANNCAACHAGSLFSDNQFHYTGVRPVNDDHGRFAIVGVNPNVNEGAMRTPSLRNVALRAPYMHNGRFATLADVVAFYNRGGDFNAPSKDPRVHPLNLNAQQQAALVAFMGRPLTDLRVQAESGPFARPTLYTESDRQPQIVGTGVTGSGGTQAQIEALEPPILGNHNFTVAVSQALGGAHATLVVAHNDPGVQASVPNGDFANLAVTLAGSGAAAGTGSVNVDLGDNTSLIGQTLYGRYYIADPGAPNGLAVTAAFQINVFGSGDHVFANDFD
ncbi:MAG: cytochrome c peroxidase [Dokdonella sp.]